MAKNATHQPAVMVTDDAALKEEYRRGYNDGANIAAERWQQWVNTRATRWKDMIDQIDVIHADMIKDANELSATVAPIPPISMDDTARMYPALRPNEGRVHKNPTTGEMTATPPRPAPAKQIGDTDDLPGNGIGLLKKICELYPVKLTWGQVTALLARKARGGTFNHQRKVMLERGLVTESSDIVTPTAAGFALAGIAQSSTELPPAKLRNLWQEALPDPAGRMFNALVRRGAGWHHLSVIAQDLGMAGTGGHWNNGIATLRRNGLAEMQGKESIRLAGWLL